MPTVVLAWIAGWLVTVLAAAVLRNKFYATFVAVLVGVQVLIWSGLFVDPGLPGYLGWALSPLVFVHFLMLTRPAMRPLWYRVLISWPALTFAAISLLSAPWAVAAALGFHPYGWWLPWVVGVIGFLQSSFHRVDQVDITLGGDAGKLGRLKAAPGDGDPIRVAHLTDTHLGPFVSVARVKAACEAIVAQEPDLVLITGDFMTMESSADSKHVRDGLQPLAALEGRVFACNGNHDLEAPEVLQTALDELGITLLVDDLTVVETHRGPLEIAGINFFFRSAEERIQKVCEVLGEPNHPRILMLHHPGHFKYVPDGHADLVLSGHTHGGQLGLVSLGINVTMFGVFVRCPDHGLWGQGQNRLYVSHGLGHYGFPLRIGVPAQQAVLHVFPAAD